MKTLTATLCTAAFATLTAAAQDDITMTIGYCANESADAIGLYETGLNVAAVKFEGDFLTQYAGSTVKSLSIQLGASFGSAGSVFVTDELTAPIPDRFTDEQDIPGFDWVPCYEWIDIPLEHPFTLNPDEPFYAGIRILPYTDDTNYGNYQFAVDDNVEAAKHSYIYDEKAKTWSLTTKKKWTDLTAPSFLIRLVVSGSALPTNDIAVTALSSKDYMRTSETTSATFTVTNLAANDITAFDADLILDGTLASTTHFDLEKPLVTKGEATFTLEGVAYATEGTHTIAVVAKNPNGVADTHPEDNKAEREISVIDRYFNHNILAEAFTTMSCANCPIAHERQDEAFDGLASVVRVDHHSGFGTDLFTTQADRDFIWFYNNGEATYAPGIMLDRALLDDIFDLQRSPGEEHSPIFGGSLYPEDFRYIHDVLTERPAYVDVNIASAYDPATRHLSITVSGEAIAKLKGDNPTLNVWLTESGLKSKQPQSGSSLGVNFVHNHVMRTTLTGSWGKPVNLGIGTYDETFTTTLDDAWKPENMEIVAFISNFDAQRPDNCIVHNSAAAAIGGDPTGIVSPALSTQAPAAFDLAGRRINASTTPAVVIIRTADGSTRKAIVR